MPWRDTAVELQKSSRSGGESFGRYEQRKLAARGWRPITLKTTDGVFAMVWIAPPLRPTFAA